ncbi:hypothetical protein QE152_g24822 [Popillia japonica]|uniref:Uncharacterized protein n=1 Tax=Popillia japonica TaxID=7064 RepID=A0AAW1K3I5_POPJA
MEGTRNSVLKRLFKRSRSSSPRHVQFDRKVSTKSKDGASFTTENIMTVAAQNRRYPPSRSPQHATLPYDYKNLQISHTRKREKNERI